MHNRASFQPSRGNRYSPRATGVPGGGCRRQVAGDPQTVTMMLSLIAAGARGRPLGPELGPTPSVREHASGPRRGQGPTGHARDGVLAQVRQSGGQARHHQPESGPHCDPVMIAGPTSQRAGASMTNGSHRRCIQARPRSACPLRCGPLRVKAR